MAWMASFVLSASLSYIRITSLFPHRGIYPNVMFSFYLMERRNRLPFFS